jgi:RHS repeat-associated protein
VVSESGKVRVAVGIVLIRAPGGRRRIAFSSSAVNSFGIANAYDFENHMITHGGVTIVYDGDGNRVSETVGGVTTNYLVDTVTPTGYAQVVDELQGGTVTRTYAYGLERINENQILNSAWTPSFYGYDGHGSVRQLTNSAGGVTDRYDYDAFGNLINQTGSTPNNYLFAGEQYDSALSLYYNRARYYNTTTGRFWSMDTVEGNTHDPLSLHKYLYVANNAPNLADPSGQDFDLGSTLAAVGDALTIAGQAVVQFGTVLGNIYYTLGPALPLIVEKGFFYLAAGAVVTQVLAGAPDALRAIDNLANNIQSYNGQFSAAKSRGWVPCVR